MVTTPTRSSRPNMVTEHLPATGPDTSTAIAIGVAIGGAIGGAVKPLFDYLKSLLRHKVKVDEIHRNDEAEAGLRKEYLAFMDRLQAQIFSLQSDMNNLQEELRRQHIRAQERESSLLVQMGVLQAENAALKERVKHLETLNGVLERDVERLRGVGTGVKGSCPLLENCSHDDSAG